MKTIINAVHFIDKNMANKVLRETSIQFYLFIAFLTIAKFPSPRVCPMINKLFRAVSDLGLNFSNIGLNLKTSSKGGDSDSVSSVKGYNL